MFSIALCRQSGDKWQSKTLFLTIFDLRSSIVLTFSIAAYPVWDWLLTFLTHESKVTQLIFFRVWIAIGLKEKWNAPISDENPIPSVWGLGDLDSDLL